MGPDIGLRWIPSVSVAHTVGQAILNLNLSQPLATGPHAGGPGESWGPGLGGLAARRAVLGACFVLDAVPCAGASRAHAHTGAAFLVLSPDHIKMVRERGQVKWKW